jgi:hypothetical protein
MPQQSTCSLVTHVTPLAFAFAFALGCSEPQVPSHDVVVTSDCRGQPETARYHFSEMDFETTCFGGLLSGSCDTTYDEGQLVWGDIGALYFRLAGTEEFGPSRYELEVVPAGHTAAEYVVFDPDNRTIWCGWYVDADLHLLPDDAEPSCYYTPMPCSVELDVLK